MPSNPPLPPSVRKNIQTISEIEKRLLRKRSRLERVGEAVARFFGSLGFVVAHILFLAAWLLVNTGKVHSLRAFDPYPFAFLGLVVGIEFIFLTTFVLFNQKHEIRRTEQWQHLHLQLSILTEQEVTKNLQLLEAVCRRLGIQEHADDLELTHLTRPTAVGDFVGELQKSREGNNAPTQP